MWQQITWINNLVQDTATVAGTCGWIKPNQKLLMTNAGPTANMTLRSIIKCRPNSKHDTAEYHQMQAQQQT